MEKDKPDKIYGEGRIFLKKKSRFLWIQYNWRGKTFRESSKSEDPRVAQRLLRKRLGELEKGKRPSKNYEKVVFEDLEKLILNDYELNKKKSVARLKTSLTHLKEFFGFYHVIDITPEQVDEYTIQRRNNGGSDSSLQKELSALKRMFSLAIEKGVLETKPVIHIKEPDNARKGFFEESDFRKVVDHLTVETKPLALFGYFTGWRISEIRSLTWRQVDFNGGVIRLEVGATKNGKGRIFPFSSHPELYQLMLDQKQKVETNSRTIEKIIPWVFPRSQGGPVKDFRHVWKKACEKAGVPGMIFHDFRRTAVRNLIKAGVPEKVAMEITGHRTRSVFDRYHIVDERDLREAVHKVAHFKNPDPEKVASVQTMGKQ